MKKITSLRQYALSNPDKRRDVDYVKLAKANENIKLAIKDNAKERRAAVLSASSIMLTK
jgi:hypothetical protein